MAQNPDLKVVTDEVRLSYVHLLEPFAQNPDQEPSYSVCLLIPKKRGKATIDRIRRAQKAALEGGKGKFGGKIPKVWTDTLRDGDEEIDLKEHPEYAGHMFINVSARKAYPPAVVDRQRNPIDDASEIYSGCYGRVSMVAFAFNTNGNKGVSFGLRNVQKLRDGESLTGASSPDDDFDDLDDDDDDMIG